VTANMTKNIVHLLNTIDLRGTELKKGLCILARQLLFIARLRP
jgi:hypothetical protein